MAEARKLTFLSSLVAHAMPRRDLVAPLQIETPLWAWLGPLTAVAVAAFVACCLDLDGTRKRAKRPAAPAAASSAASAAAAAARMCTAQACACDAPFGFGPGRRQACWAAPPPAPPSAAAAKDGGEDGVRARPRPRPSAWPAYVAGSDAGRLGGAPE